MVFPFEWLDLGRAFLELGFSGVTAFLLYERFITARRRDSIFAAVVDTVNNNAKAFHEHAVATQRLADMVESQSKELGQIRNELLVIATNRARGR